VLQVGLLVEVAAHETTHVRGAVGILSGGDAAEDLEVGRGEVVVGVGIELTLILGGGGNRDGHAGGVRIGFLPGEPVDFGASGVERSQHVVKGTVLHHQHDNVLQILYAW